MAREKAQTALEKGLPLMTVKRAAGMAGVTVDTVRRWVREGKVAGIRPRKVGSSRLLIRTSSLLAYLDPVSR